MTSEERAEALAAAKTTEAAAWVAYANATPRSHYRLRAAAFDAMEARMGLEREQ